jgi:hypothetical protein
VAYDAILVGSYAHKDRWYLQNLIPGPLLREMVEKRFLMRSVDQQVQDVLEPGRFAQTCQHNRAPGRRTVNIPSRPLKVFATFVTVADLHAYSTGGQSLVLGAQGFTALVAVERETAMGFMRGRPFLTHLTLKPNEDGCWGARFQDLFAMTFLVGAAKHRKKPRLPDLCRKVPTAVHTIGTAHPAPEVPELF